MGFKKTNDKLMEALNRIKWLLDLISQCHVKVLVCYLSNKVKFFYKKKRFLNVMVIL